MERRWFLLSHEAQLVLIKHGRRKSLGALSQAQVLCEDRLAIRSYSKKSDFDEETAATPKTAQAVGSLSGKVDHYACQPRKNPSQGKAHWLKINLLSALKSVVIERKSLRFLLNLINCSELRKSDF